MCQVQIRAVASTSCRTGLCKRRLCSRHGAAGSMAVANINAPIHAARSMSTWISRSVLMAARLIEPLISMTYVELACNVSQRRFQTSQNKERRMSSVLRRAFAHARTVSSKASNPYRGSTALAETRLVLHSRDGGEEPRFVCE
jgi:hypothetical protein